MNGCGLAIGCRVNAREVWKITVTSLVACITPLSSTGGGVPRMRSFTEMRGLSYTGVDDQSVERREDVEDSVAKSDPRGKRNSDEFFFFFFFEDHGHIREGLVTTRAWRTGERRNWR